MTTDSKHFKNLKVVIVHDYLIHYGGAEKTLEALLEIFPEAPVYCGIYNKKNMSEKINKAKIISLTSAKLSGIIKYFTFLMPILFESIDLREYDLILSTGTAWPKGVLTNTDQVHISYVHTPPRFLYGYSVESQKRDKWYFKPFILIIDAYLRVWDYQSAQRPDFLLTNSEETKSRIKKFWNRNATVIYPPVDVPNNQKGLNEYKGQEYYLALGRLSPYKNFDIIAKAFQNLDLKIFIAGTGPAEEDLKKTFKASKNIIFLGKVTEAQKQDLLENALGLINAVEDEDLGIVPIEAMMYGKPVLAHNSGGHKETIREGIDGMFFTSLDPDNLRDKILKFHELVINGKFNATEISGDKKRFSKVRFQKEILEYVKQNARIT